MSDEPVSDGTTSIDDGTAHDDGARDTSTRAPVDLERIERDLAGVEAALTRLDDGTYWTDEVTGQPIPDEVLETDPVARTIG